MKTPVWLPTGAFHDYELVSLLELMKYNEGLFRGLGALWGILTTVRQTWTAFGTPSPSLSDPTLEALKKTVNLLQSEPSIADVPLLSVQVTRVAAAFGDTDHERLVGAVDELYGRIEDFMRGQMVLVIPASRKQEYEQPLAYWGDIASRFPRALDSMEEANKCYALGRNTATVFHCMAIIQEGLDSLATHLKIRVDPFATWETIISDIDNAIKAKRALLAKRKWKTMEAFYDESLSDLRSVKNAWRNPTMHFRRSYDETQANKVRERVKDFMLHLGTKLKGRPPRKLLGA